LNGLVADRVPAAEEPRRAAAVVDFIRAMDYNFIHMQSRSWEEEQ